MNGDIMRVSSRGIILVAIVLTLPGCVSEVGGPSTSLPLWPTSNTQLMNTDDVVETHEDRHLTSVPQGDARGDGMGGGAGSRTEDESADDSDPSEALGPSRTTEVRAAEPRRPSIRLRSKVWMLDAETMPHRPFEGIVQLRWSTDHQGQESGLAIQGSEGWHLWFYQYNYSGARAGWSVGYVPLPDLVVDCVGDVGLISRGADGVEVGGPPRSVNASFLVPWSGTPQKLAMPSQKLLEEIALRPSNVTATAVGDFLDVGAGDGQVRYALREPARADGEWWEVQARHDGEVFVMTVHPAHHECFSGVTWLSVAASGELLACGADTAATKYVNSEGGHRERLELPVADELPQYLECAYPLSHHSLR